MTKNNNKPKAILPRGFKDSEKQLLTLRKIVTEVIEEECQKFGFVELETSSIEYTDSLGKFLPDIDRPSEEFFRYKMKMVNGYHYDMTLQLL